VLSEGLREYYIMIVGGTLTMLAGGFVWPIFAPFVRDEFTAPIQLVGLAVSGYFLLRMLGEFPIGVLSDKVGPKAPLMAGRALALVGSFICFRTTNIWALILARVIWGMGDASYFCIGMSYVSRIFTNERRGRALGFFQAVELIGSFLGQTAGGFVAANFGPRMNFLVCTGLSLTTLLLVTLIKGTAAKVKPGGTRISLIPSKEILKKVLNGTVVAACVINLGCMIINNGLMGTVLPIYATGELMIPITNYALMVSGSTVGSVTGNLAGGFLSDKMGRRRILAAGLAVGAAAVFMLTLFTTFLPLLGVMFLQGVFWGIVYSVIPAFIADAVPDQVRGTGIGTYRTFMDMGGLVGPIIMSNLVNYLGYPQGYLYSFYVGSAILLGCLALIVGLKERR